VKIAELDNPVRASWLAEQSLRLDARPYVSAAYAARTFLRHLPRTDRLDHATTRIFHPGRVKRQWTTDPKYGVPFLGSADIFEADLSWLPLISTGVVESNGRMLLESGWTLITRSGMTAGRVTRARLDMDGLASSEDVLRVVPDPSRIPSGYLNAFLSSRFGISVIKGGIYGTSVRHIEPHHIADLPVPRFGDEAETAIHDLMEKAAVLRERFQRGIVGATRDLFESARIQNLLNLRWADSARASGFEVVGVDSRSLRALNYDYRVQGILRDLQSVSHRPLGGICAGGRFDNGPRFKRVDAESGQGVCLVGQRQGMWFRPEGRWINRSLTPAGVFVEDETIVISRRGLVGESAGICRVALIFGNWTKFAFSEDFLRLRPGDPDFPAPYVFAFLRSEAAFRCLRSMLVGTGPQEINLDLCGRLPVPECTKRDRDRIADTVRSAFRDRDEADRKEDQATALLERAVREAAR
jgi:hypothetical protein